MLIAPTFAALASSSDSVCILSPERKLVRVNAGWKAFAIANDGEQVLDRWKRGTSIDDAMSPELRAFYAAGFQRVLQARAPWFHDYECSSASRFRKFRMGVYPTDGDFLLVVHARTIERPHEEPGLPAGPGYAVDGVITSCSHCRRTRCPGAPERWDWVPEYVESPPAGVSHGLCTACAAFYHGAQQAPVR